MHGLLDDPRILHYRGHRLSVVLSALYNCMARDKAKFTVCSIIKLATIAFDETSSYWSESESS